MSAPSPAKDQTRTEDVTARPLALQLLEGDEARAMLEDPSFIAAWTALARIDPKETVIQEPAFVTTWYNRYKLQYAPVLCLGRANGGDLVGLMPLAQHRASGELTHAGAQQGEYHGWIATPAQDGVFPVECLIALKRRFSPHRWGWRWMPPGSPSSWMTSERLQKEGIFARVAHQQSPLMDLADAERLEALTRSKSLKVKHNRFKRRGNLHLERVTTPERTLELMPALRRQYDFRQRAVHDVSPFLDDIEKAQFYIDRQRHPEATHFTVLWAGKSPIAFHYGARSERAVLLGLMTYDPLEGRNSPGHILLLELMKRLRDEGIRYFDLTPGGDEYKERFANTTQPLYAPTFYFSRRDALFAQGKRHAADAAKRVFQSVGVAPAQVRQVVEQANAAVSVVRQAAPPTLLVLARKAVFDRKEYALYRLKESHRVIDTPRADPDPEVGVQRYEDLLLYRGNHRWLSRQELLLSALRKLATGEILYVLNQEGGLAHFAWVKKNARKHRFENVQLPVSFPDDSVLIYDFFNGAKCCSKGCPCVRNLRQMVADSFRAGAKEVFVGIDDDNADMRRVVEETGFELSGVLFKQRLLWWRREGFRLNKGRRTRGGGE